MKPRAFWPILLLTALAGLVIRVYVGAKTFVSFDEWQHLFMASSARWADLSFELRTNAHPPLFFLLLRGIVRLGIANTLLYRAISIAAGTASIVVVGLIARKIFDSPIVQLLCAAAFALSIDAISISDEIRSYQLAVLFTLLAFWVWLKMFDTDEIRPHIAFAIFASLAISTHYSAAFFLGACLTVPVLLRMPPKSPVRFTAALAIPCAVFAIAYFVHAEAQPPQGYLADFYYGYTPNESARAFVVRNFRNFCNLFSAIELRDTPAFPIAVLFIAAIVMYAIRKRRRAALAIAFALIIVGELLAGGLTGKYPFGGMLRHQYIAGPFLLIAAFAAVDALLPLAPHALRFAIPGLLLAASIANLIGGQQLIFYPGTVLLKQDFQSWHDAFPHARAVYLDHWGVIMHFIHTSDQPRTFVRRIADEATIDEYRTPDGVRIFHDKSRFRLGLSDPSVYRSFAACLRASGVSELSLLYYSPGDQPVDDDPTGLAASIVRHAADQGLATTKVVIGHTTIGAGFKLKDSPQ